MTLGITSAGAALVRDLLRNAATAPPLYHVALVCTVPPGFTIGGEELDEPRYPEYARGVLANDSASWSVTGLLMANLQEVTFPVSVSEWGQISYLAVCDQPLSIGGTVLFVGEMDSPLYVEANKQVTFPAGSFGIDIGGYQWMNAGMP